MGGGGGGGGVGRRNRHVLPTGCRSSVGDLLDQKTKAGSQGPVPDAKTPKFGFRYRTPETIQRGLRGVWQCILYVHVCVGKLHNNLPKTRLPKSHFVEFRQKCRKGGGEEPRM